MRKVANDPLLKAIVKNGRRRICLIGASERDTKGKKETGGMRRRISRLSLSGCQGCPQRQRRAVGYKARHGAGRQSLVML
jgi:hypothetical protein